MKVNKAFRIPFITKKQLKSRVFAENFLEGPVQSIQRCLNPLFQLILFWCSLIFINISIPRLEPTNGNPCCLPPLPFKISLEANINTDQTSDLKFKQLHTFSAGRKLQCVFILYVHF